VVSYKKKNTEDFIHSLGHFYLALTFRLSAFMCTNAQKLNEAPGLGLHYGEERMLSKEYGLIGLFRDAELEHVALSVKGNPGEVVVIDLFDLHVLLEGNYIPFAAF